MPTIRTRLQACIDEAERINASGLRKTLITDERVNEAISQEIFLAVQNGEISNEEGDELYLEYTA